MAHNSPGAALVKGQRMVDAAPRRSHRRGVYPFLLALVTVAGAGIACGPQEVEITPATPDGDRILFELGQEALMEEDWLTAREYFLQVRDNYPQSPLRAAARLGVADSYEGQGGADNYVSALAEYEDFLRLYPTSERADYAQYKLALVHQHQMRSPERDQSWTRSAIREFEFFIERYPNSPLLPEAQVALRAARDRLSESEFIVGRYYYRNKWWPGAIDRLRAVMESDPEFSGRGDVYFYLADSLYQSGELAEALPLFKRVEAEFPAEARINDVALAIADIEQQLSVGTATAVDSPLSTTEPTPPVDDPGQDSTDHR